MMPATKYAIETYAGQISELADELNRAMARNPEARARYAEIYGEAWELIPAIGGAQYFDGTQNVRTESTEASTYI